MSRLDLSNYMSATASQRHEDAGRWRVAVDYSSKKNYDTATLHPVDSAGLQIDVIDALIDGPEKPLSEWDSD